MTFRVEIEWVLSTKESTKHGRMDGKLDGITIP